MHNQSKFWVNFSISYYIILAKTLGHFPQFISIKNENKNKNCRFLATKWRIFKFYNKYLENQLKLLKYMTGLNFETIRLFLQISWL